MDWKEMEELVEKVLEARLNLARAKIRLEKVKKLIPPRPQIVRSQEEWDTYVANRNAAFDLEQHHMEEKRVASAECRKLETELADGLPSPDVVFKLNGHAVQLKRNTYTSEEFIIIKPWSVGEVEVDDDQME